MGSLARDLRTILRDHGWRPLRQGKGDHEIWHHPDTGRKVVVDAGMVSHHTANGVLKQAGLPKHF